VGSIAAEMEVFMSIKPIDMQVMMPRTTEVSKIHNDQQNRNQILQQGNMATLQHKAEGDLNKVMQKGTAEKISIKDDEEKKRRERENKKEEKKNKKDNESGSKFDVKI
jgi:hypothetical protein